MDAVLFDQEDPGARGEAHGELWRAEIHALAEIRLELALSRGRFRDVAQVLAIARLHLPVLEATDRQLHAELMGIARGADVTPERVVVLNHYTDLRDIVPDDHGAEDPSADPGGCTALYVYGPEGPVLGQTWDMHASAEPFVRLIRIAPQGTTDEVVCFTLTGCLGMAGMGARGVAITINNLTSTDARVGMIWPAVVRRMLACRSAASAKDLLMDTHLSSGHHYMIADANDFFGVETSGRLKVVTQRGPRAAHIHTNHCFDPVLRKYERIMPSSTTYRRLDSATTLFVQQRPNTMAGVWALLNNHEGYPSSVCSHLEHDDADPSASKTCGIVVMSPAGGNVAAARGCAPFEAATKLRLERFVPMSAVEGG